MSELLDDESVATALRDLAWARAGDELEKVHKADGFRGAMRFVNSVAELAEAADHHPDIDIRWNTVTLRLSTHSAGGITRRDLDLAAQIDALG